VADRNSPMSSIVRYLTKRHHALSTSHGGRLV
jgi:hypothetical protein